MSTASKARADGSRPEPRARWPRPRPRAQVLEHADGDHLVGRVVLDHEHVSPRTVSERASPRPRPPNGRPRARPPRWLAARPGGRRAGGRGWTGLVSVADMPAARASPGVSSGLEVSSRVGGVGRPASGASRVPRSSPSMPGMHMSSTTRVYGLPAAACSEQPGECGLAVVDGVGLHAPGAELFCEDQAVRRVVVDDEGTQSGQVRVAVVDASRVAGRLERHGEPEGAAPTGRAVDADLARPSLRSAGGRSPGRDRCRRSGASWTSRPARRPRTAGRCLLGCDADARCR